MLCLIILNSIHHHFLTPIAEAFSSSSLAGAAPGNKSQSSRYPQNSHEGNSDGGLQMVGAMNLIIGVGYWPTDSHCSRHEYLVANIAGQRTAATKETRPTHSDWTNLVEYKIS